MASYEQQEPDSALTFHIRSLLGAALHGQQKLDEAEPLLIEGYVGLAQHIATQHAFTRFSTICHATNSRNFAWQKSHFSSPFWCSTVMQNSLFIDAFVAQQDAD